MNQHVKFFHSLIFLKIFNILVSGKTDQSALAKKLDKDYQPSQTSFAGGKLV